MKLSVTFRIVFMMSILNGCCSIVSKSDWPVTINSSPSGAEVTIKNRSGMEINKATTPMTLSLPASSGYFSSASYTLEFEKPGYNSSSTSVSAHLNPWYWGNILFGGLIGMLIVDPATGAMWKLNDSAYGNLSQSPNAIASTPAPLSEDIAVRLKNLKEARDKGLLTEPEYQTKRKAIIDEL